MDGDDDRVGDGGVGVGRGGDGDVEVDLTAAGNDDDTMCAIESDVLILVDNHFKEPRTLSAILP